MFRLRFRSGSTTREEAGERMEWITCSAAYGSGGLGGLLAEVVERARGVGGPLRYLAGGIRPGDEAIGRVIRQRLAPLLCRIPPIRFNPGWRQFLTFDLFDRAAARHLTQAPDGVLAFAGQALHTFARARRLGDTRLLLLAPTSHINHVWRQHRLAEVQYPIEGDWLSPAHREKVLEEYRLADEILIISEYARLSFLDDRIPPQKLRRILLTAPARFSKVRRESPDDTFRIVYTGALSVVKGIPVLIEAFSQLATRRAELTLVGGSGTRGMRRYIEAACRADRRIVIAPGDPLPHLRRADVYVHPSYQDGLGYAVLEAIACGVPVIVTGDTGARESVIEGENGWVVPTGSVEAIRRRLEHLMASHPACERPCAS
jgi:glycosyltransferase involved in cell wall biosynthesis